MNQGLTVEQARERAAYNASIKSIRHDIGTATVDLGQAAAKATVDPQTALARLDSAIELLAAGRALLAAITKPEVGQQ